MAMIVLWNFQSICTLHEHNILAVITLKDPQGPIHKFRKKEGMDNFRKDIQHLLIYVQADISPKVPHLVLIIRKNVQVARAPVLKELT